MSWPALGIRVFSELRTTAIRSVSSARRGAPGPAVPRPIPNFHPRYVSARLKSGSGGPPLKEYHLETGEDAFSAHEAHLEDVAVKFKKEDGWVMVSGEVAIPGQKEAPTNPNLHQYTLDSGETVQTDKSNSDSDFHSELLGVRTERGAEYDMESGEHVGKTTK